MENDDEPLVRGGQSRKAEDLEWDTRVFIFCVFAALMILELCGCATSLPRNVGW